MCKLIEWPHYDQADAFRFNKVINEPDFLPLHVVRQLAQAATLVRAQRGVPGTQPFTRWRPESSDRYSGSGYWNNAAKRFQTVHSGSVVFIVRHSCSIDYSPSQSK